MAQSTAPKHESLRRATYQDVLDAPAQKSTSHMTQRFPLVPANAPANRFGWRHDGPGPQLDNDPNADKHLLPAERFDHPELKRRPPYVPERIGRGTFTFMVRKGCAGLAHHYRREPESLYRRVMHKSLNKEDGAALRWALSGFHHDKDFVRLHTKGRLTIEELAYLVRWAYGEDHTPYRSWLNQWGGDPQRPLPSLFDTIELETENDLIGLHIDDIPVGDDRRIDENGFTYIKLNGHMYWFNRRSRQRARARKG